MDTIKQVLEICSEGNPSCRFTRPFNAKGKPSRYVGMLIPFLHKERATKNECLKVIGINTSIISKGYFSKYFTTFNKAKILKYNSSRRYWEKGENFDEEI